MDCQYVYISVFFIPIIRLILPIDKVVNRICDLVERLMLLRVARESPDLKVDLDNKILIAYNKNLGCRPQDSVKESSSAKRNLGPSRGNRKSR